MDEYLTTEEIAKLLKVNVVTIRRYIDRGVLPALFLGREYRVKRLDLEDFLQKQKKRNKR